MYSRLEQYVQELSTRLRSLPAAQREEELREMREHLSHLAADNEELGGSEEEAVAAAIRQFGDSRAVGRGLVQAWQRNQRATRLIFVGVLGAALFLTPLTLAQLVLVPAPLRGAPHAPSAMAQEPDPQVPLPKLTLKLAWNGKVYRVPAPALLPASARRTEEYRRWLRVGGDATFTFTRDDGKKCRAHMIGLAQDAAGKPQEIIGSVALLRADGTLETETAYSGVVPVQWTTYGPDGKTKVVLVTSRTNGLPGTPFIESVNLYGPGGGRQYRANRHGIVYLEWELAPDGIQITGRKLHGSSRLDAK